MGLCEPFLQPIGTAGKLAALVVTTAPVEDLSGLSVLAFFDAPDMAFWAGVF